MPLTLEGQEISLALSQEKISSSNGELISSRIKISNPTTAPFRGTLSLETDNSSLRIVSIKRRQINLAPSDSLFVSVRALVSSEAKVGEDYRLGAKLISNEREVVQDVLSISIQEIRMLRLTVLEEQLLYEERGDTLRIPVRITNSGNTNQSFQLLSRYAYETNNDELAAKEIHLGAFRDTTLLVSKKVDREILKLDNFSIYFRGIYSSGDVFGSGSINASSVKNSRRYSTRVDPYNYNGMRQSNIMSLSAQSSRGNMQYFFYANNEMQLKDGVLRSNFDLNFWKNNDRIMLRNSWLSYETDGYGVKAGNIFRSGDVNLVGRGVEAYYSPAENQRLEFGGIDKTYDLLGSYGSGFGKAAWVRFSENGGWLRNGYEGSLIYEDEPRTNQRNILASGKTSIINKQDMKLRAGLSASNSMLYSDTGTSKAGGAGEISFFVRDGNLSVNGDYFFSSPYYSGLRQGATHINQRLSYRLKKTNYWVAYNLLTYQPKRLSESQYRGSDFSTDRYSVGVSRRLKNLSFSLSPNYYDERRKNRYFSVGNIEETYRMKAARLMVGLNFSEPLTRQNASMDFEGGYYGTNVGDEKEPHYKASFNYNWGFFNLNAYYQYNPFYVSELISNVQYSSDEVFIRSSIIPSLQQSFLDDKLNVRAGFSYSRNTFSDDYVQLNGRIDLQLPYNFNAFISTFYSDFSSYYYDSSTFHFGLVKRFGSINLKDQKHKLEVYVYYDENLEGLTADQLLPAVGEIVIINKKVFRTDEKGVITYKGLPEGTYKVKMFNTKEWYAPEREVALIKNTSIAIGMNKTISVKGSISYLTTERSYEVEKKMLGHGVVFTARDGEQYTTRTDGRGNFRIYIPDGTYTVSFDDSGLSDLVEVQNNHRMVEVETAGENIVEFRLRVKERQVERKRFEAQPFQQRR